jgi:hypothetical protein
VEFGGAGRGGIEGAGVSLDEKTAMLRTATRVAPDHPAAARTRTLAGGAPNGLLCLGSCRLVV